MGTQVTLVYKVDALGITPTKIRPFVASAQIPPEIIASLGLRVSSDTTVVAGSLITRTVVLQFDPSIAATVSASVLENTSRIRSVTVTPGKDYIRPPIVRANNNSREPLTQIVQGNVVGRRATQVDAILKSFLEVVDFTIVAGGAGYTAPVVTFLGGLPPANAVFDARKGFRGGCVRYINIADPGEGYNPATARLNIQGGSSAGNTPPIPAQGVIAFDARGRVQSITIVDMGSAYDSVPDVFITTTDGVPARRQAKLFAVMAEGKPARATATVNPLAPNDITALAITDPGDNYISVPDILIRDPAGTGAVLVARMGVGRIDVINQGEGYFPGTTFTITPVFQEYFPTISGDPQAQNKAFFQFLQGAISQLAITPLRSDAPLVA